MNLYQPTITGSLSVSGSVNISGSITIAGGGTISGTASIATTALTASFVANAQTASYVLNAVSSSFALTASSADNFLTRGTLTAQTLVVQTITSSVDFVTGSTRFGSISANTHQFTGSVSVSGSIGIGYTTPTIALQVAGTIATGDNITGWGRFLYDNATNQARIQASKDGTDSIGLSFYTQASGGGFAERMIISGSNVGIGTSTPGARLELRTSGDEDHGLKVTYAVASNGRGLWINQPNSGGGAQSTQALIYINNSGNNPYITLDSLFTILKSGNVGIGTISTDGRLHVNAGTGQNFVVAGDGTNICSINNYSAASGFRQLKVVGSPLTFFTGNAGEGSVTEKMRITSDGYILIPSGYAATSYFSINFTNIDARSRQWRMSNDAYQYGDFGIGQATTQGGSTYQVKLLINENGFTKASNNGSFLGSSNSYHEFNSNVAEAPTLYVRNSTSTGEGIFSYMNSSSSTLSFFAGYSVSAGGYKFLSRTNGDVLNGTGVYGTISSDRRLKENIIDASSKLEDIMNLRVVNFNLIGNENKHIGFIAQEMQEVFPSFVYQSDTRKYDEDGNVISGLEDALGLKVGMEFAILVKAIQELKTEFDAYKTTHP